MTSRRRFQSSATFEHERIGAVAIYCSDGRYNEQFDEFLHKELGLPRYDRLSVPGGPAALAGHMIAQREADTLESQLRFLIEGHRLDRVVLIAHQDCGFYKRKLFFGGDGLRAQQEADVLQAKASIDKIGRLRVDMFYAAVRDGFVVIEEIRDPRP